MRKKPQKYKAGDKFYHPKYGAFFVRSYHNSKDVLIAFEKTGSTAKVQSKDIRAMSIKDYNHPHIFGVGYLGYGDYKSSENGRMTSAYSVWRSMLQRCYDKSSNGYRFYSDCTVCSEWLNFQVYAEWFYSNRVKGCHVDKDTLISGNKVYSADTCVFIPSSENIRHATQKKHSFISPEGERVDFLNLNVFCDTHGLDRINMSRVKNGHRKSHKGWKAVK